MPQRTKEEIIDWVIAEGRKRDLTQQEELVARKHLATLTTQEAQLLERAFAERLRAWDQNN